MCMCVLPFRLQNDRTVKGQGKILLFFFLNKSPDAFLSPFTIPSANENLSKAES